VERIKLVWRRGHVPAGFWDDGRSRRDYMLSSARRVRLFTMQDLHRLDLKRFYKKDTAIRP
jgi:hypothetical protein